MAVDRGDQRDQHHRRPVGVGIDKDVEDALDRQGEDNGKHADREGNGLGKQQQVARSERLGSQWLNHVVDECDRRRVV